VKRLGVVSDIHGSISALEAGLKVLEGVDGIVFVGDILYHGPRNPLPEGYNPQGVIERLNALDVPMVAVRGNCDAEVDTWVLNFPLYPYALIVLEGWRVGVVHNLDDIDWGQWRNHLEIVVCGHTHIPMCRKKSGVLVFNPGSCALPKGESKPSVGMISVGSGKIRLCVLDMAGNPVLIRELYHR